MNSNQSIIQNRSNNNFINNSVIIQLIDTIIYNEPNQSVIHNDNFMLIDIYDESLHIEYINNNIFI